MWKFLREYIKTPDTIGAVAPSSRHLAAAMTARIDFDKAKCIVEYGAGTGIFTREVCAKKRPGTVYIVIEQNDRFYSMLQKQFHGVPKGSDEITDLCASINEMSVQLSEKQELEKKQLQSKNELITNVSHDLHSPLTSIIGYVDLLKQTGPQDQQRFAEYIEVVERRLTGLNVLINELFEYTKLNSAEKIMNLLDNILR